MKLIFAIFKPTKIEHLAANEVPKLLQSTKFWGHNACEKILIIYYYKFHFFSFLTGSKLEIFYKYAKFGFKKWLNKFFQNFTNTKRQIPR